MSNALYMFHLSLMFNPSDMSDFGLMSNSLYMSDLSLMFNPRNMSDLSFKSNSENMLGLNHMSNYMFDLMPEIFQMMGKNSIFEARKLGSGSARK